MFKVRIVTVDHYMSSPIPELDVTYSDFRKSSIKHVPVIRIFGSTPSGVKTCVHVHGVFPYICIPYDGSEPHFKLSYQLAASLDKAINIASGYSTSNTHHVYKVVLVSGIPFYGYHHKRHQFLKVYFYKPSVIKQAVNLLQNGAILNKVFQPHEAHIPFILQFFIDFNLYGMSFIDFQTVKFRRTSFPELLSNIPAENILPDSIRAVSSSQYEVDALACHISNRPSSQGNGQICNPGIAAIWEDENRRRATREGTPVDIPHLHSLRPPQNPTSSELFHLDRIQRILNNLSQSSDESSLSGEVAASINKSYAIEEPPHTPALDASFVSLHVSEPCPGVDVSSEVVNPAMLEDTIVDEDMALMNSTSQHLSQALDRSLALDFEDLELLDVLENLANTRSATVDADSVLGSQATKPVCRPTVSVGDDDEANSEGEDEHWSEKTLVAEEDDALKLFDLTMPDFDENAILNEHLQNAPGPSTSASSRESSQIPQIDGSSDRLKKEGCKSRRVFQIPQVDGANDIPSKSGRKSLGMRGARNRQNTAPTNKVLTDERYIPGTTELIFKAKKKSESASSTVHQSLVKDNKLSQKPSLPSQSDFLYPSSIALCDNQKTQIAGPSFTIATQATIENTIQEEDMFLTQATIENTIQEEDMLLSQPTIENTIQEEEAALVYLLPSEKKEAVGPCSSLSNEALLLQSYYPEHMPLQDNEVVDNSQPHSPYCTSTVGGSEEMEEGEHCTDTFIGLLANKRRGETILRGDPSLYPQAPPDKEDSLTELITSVASVKNNSDAKFSDENHVSSQEPTSSTSVRRSSRLSVTRERAIPPLVMQAKAPDDTWNSSTIHSTENADQFEDPDGNMTPGSISDLSVSGIGPLLTTTMFNDIRNNLDFGSPNTDASCSDSELCRLKDALDNDEMEQILQTGAEVLIPEPSILRREELMRVITESSQLSKQQAYDDPVTDELLHRGELPRKGPPVIGKNMDHLRMHCGAPASLKRRQSTVSSTIGRKELKRVRREERRLKLSVSAQRRKREQDPPFDLKPCSVLVEKLTKKNIYYQCRKFQVVLEDKSAFGIKSRKLSNVNSFEAKSPLPPKSNPSLMPPSCSRAVSKSAVLSCGRTRRSYSKLELSKAKLSLNLEELDTSQDERLLQGKTDLNPSEISVESSQGGDQRLKENPTLSSAPIKEEQSTSFDRSLRSRKKHEPSQLLTSLINMEHTPENGAVPHMPEEKEILPDHNSGSRDNSSKTDEAKSPSSVAQKSTPQKYVATPGSKPTSIKISCRTLLEYEAECSGEETISSGVLDDNDLIKKQNGHHKKNLLSTLEEILPKSKELSCRLAASMISSEITTSGSGQKSVEISLKLADSDLDACSQSSVDFNTAAVEKQCGESMPASNCLQDVRIASHKSDNIERRKEPFENFSVKGKLSTNMVEDHGDSKLKAIEEESSLPTKKGPDPNTKAIQEKKSSASNQKEAAKHTRPSSNRKINSDKLSKGSSKSISVLGSLLEENSPSLKNLECVPENSPSKLKVRRSKSNSKSTYPSSENGDKKKSNKYSASVLQKKPAETNGKGKHLGVVDKSSSSSKPAPLGSRRVSNSSAKTIPIADIIPELQCSSLLKNFKIPKKAKNKKEDVPLATDLNESTNDSSLLVSLDTSSIELDLSSSSGDENAFNTAGKNALAACFKTLKKTSNRILCVDGASTESSSDSSSGRQETSQEPMSSQQPLKRKLVEEDTQQKVKVQRDGNQKAPDIQVPGTSRNLSSQSAPDIQMPQTSRDLGYQNAQNIERPSTSRQLPQSVAHWFDKQYGPWTMWSPNVSPISARIDISRDVSPPEPFSPDDRSGFATMSHGCMEEDEDIIKIRDKQSSTPSFGQDFFMRLKSMESSNIESGRNLELHTETEPTPGVMDDGLEKSSQSSIQDMFSEKSFHLHEDDIAEENKSLHSVLLNASPPSKASGNCTELDVDALSEHNESMQEVIISSHESSDIPCGQATGKGSSLEKITMQDDVILSRESSDIPCGQWIEKRSSQENVPMQEDVILSHGSSDIPCGQGTGKESSQGKVLMQDDVILSHGSSDIPYGQGAGEESSQGKVPMQEDVISSFDLSDILDVQAARRGISQEKVQGKLSSDFKPVQKPPTRKEVLDSLPFFNLPEVVNPDPHFSNYQDVKGKVDVGSNVLELTSNNSLHLEEFRSNIDGLRGFNCQQKQLFARCWGLSQVRGDFNQLVSTHLNQRTIIICPVKKPPKVKDVATWAKAREMALEAKKSSDEKKDEEEETSLNLELQSSLNVSLHSAPSKLSQTDKKVEASTPESSMRKLKKLNVPSPRLTPILTRSQSKSSCKSKKFLKKLETRQSLLPSVSEKDENDLGVLPLDKEVQVEVSNTSQDNSCDTSSVKRLLLDSQFCQDAASPLFRHDSDTSACQIKGITASPGFKMDLENLQTVKTKKEHQYITTLTMEVHVCTCGALNPDPERDPIRAVFYSVCNDVPEDSKIPASVNGIIAVNCNNSTPLLNRCGISGVIEYVNDEKSLLQSLVSLVHKWDPDILSGFEIEMLSWGYVLQRACVIGINISQEFSRIPDQRERKQHEEFEDNNGLSGLKITGRIVLDAWRLFRSEVALQSYTFENLMYHILHKRVCHHTFESLSRWWEHPSHLHRWITVQYYQQRVSGIIKLLDQLDLIGRTSELARLFGIQFFEVLSRGSQFRVESMMLRLAKPLNFIPVSPSVQQRAHMRAPECLALIMEPESRFYNDPMIVLDFQSLYPSMIIAYNYCFSTCMGRVEHLGKSGHFEFGCSELRIKNSLLRHLKDDISISPSGVAFVTKKVRQGVLPRMLEEILEARLAVKQSMKMHKNDPTLQRVLHARQLGLKLIANVTYGYTSANFSGRMPCIEVGDSVVSKGRETLERAISLVQNNEEWRAKVVYGDTDSLFVLIPGRNREEAFRIGAEIASAVTQDNPSPVKLKLEKVYQPCILQTKKRYVGFMYESPDQTHPVYEAKGIETVRRDGCPAVSKMLEKSLKILFETRDVSSVKKYVSHQFSKILSGRANIQDLIFAREYRGKENYRAGACVPALELTKRWLRQDRRSEPRIGERVPYVVTNGPPGSALIHLVRHPKELLSDQSLRYNAVYYVTRAIIPPLARCFSLLGADVLSWYSDLPRKFKLSLPVINQAGFKKTISQYFSTMECACCGALTHGGVCAKCQSNPQLLVTSLMSKLHSLELTHTSITKICQSCLGRSAPLDCTSLDCPITYRRHQSSQKLEQTAFISQLLNDLGFS